MATLRGETAVGMGCSEVAHRREEEIPKSRIRCTGSSVCLASSRAVRAPCADLETDACERSADGLGTDAGVGVVGGGPRGDEQVRVGAGWYPDDGGAEVFVHHTSVTASGFRNLDEGQAVESDVTNGPKDLGPQRG